MIHLVKVELINLFLFYVSLREISISFQLLYLSFLLDFAWIFLFLFLFSFSFLKSGDRCSYHRVLQGYIIAFFTALYVEVWCSAFICSI